MNDDDAVDDGQEFSKISKINFDHNEMMRWFFFGLCKSIWRWSEWEQKGKRRMSILISMQEIYNWITLTEFCFFNHFQPLDFPLVRLKQSEKSKNPYKNVYSVHKKKQYRQFIELLTRQLFEKRWIAFRLSGKKKRIKQIQERKSWRNRKTDFALGTEYWFST